MELNILDLGRCEYAKALAIQLETVESVQCGRTGDTLILVEHPAIITLGRNAKPENLLATNMQLNSMGIDLQSVTRGGDITYHGPGQLVGYPIFHLKERHGGSIRMFVNRLESVLMDVLQEEWQITSGRDSCNSGVWVGNDKIAAIGLAVKRGVTMHGFSLNLSTDLSHYSTMIPCGLQGRGVTTVERLVGHPVSLESAPSAVIRNFRKHYGFDR